MGFFLEFRDDNEKLFLFLEVRQRISTQENWIEKRKNKNRGKGLSLSF